MPGLYVAGTLQAGRWTDRIFIENSRDHGPKIIAPPEEPLAAVPALRRRDKVGPGGGSAVHPPG